MPQTVGLEDIGVKDSHLEDYYMKRAGLIPIPRSELESMRKARK